MNFDYSYTKRRLDFGKRCHFRDKGPTLTLDIRPDSVLARDFVYKRYMHKGIQVGPIMSGTEMCLDKKAYESRGMFHEEGGWPKEINPRDEEQVERFQKRTQRDDNYVEVMQKLTKKMEKAVLQNNAVNVFTNYFEGFGSSAHRVDTRVRVINVYRAPSIQCKVRRVSWHPGACSEMVVTLESPESHAWKMSNPNEPKFTLTAPSPMTCLEYTFKDNRVGSGLESGQVAVWDARVGGNPLAVSATERSHRAPVSALLWIASKAGTEFFSVAGDGWAKWWDSGKIKKPKDELEIGPPLTALEYDQTIPTRFMIGTADGYVVSGNRRGTTLQEKLPWKIKVREGPVLEVDRNPAFPKILLVVGGRSAQIWSEDCRESPILWTPRAPVDIAHAEWSPTRYSVIVTVREDGYLDVWDFLERRNAALRSIRIANVGLTSVFFHEDGENVAVGTEDGSVFVVRLSDNLIHMTIDEKAQLAATFDREVAREKVIESKWREARMKAKAHAADSPRETVEEEEREISWNQELTTEYLSSVRATLENVETRKKGSASKRENEDSE